MTWRRTPSLRGPVTRGTAAFSLAVVAVLVAGCGEARVRADDDLCAQYDQLVEGVGSLDDIDPDTASFDEVRDRVDEVGEQLDALQAVAEGRLDTLISTLRSDVQDLASAASDAGTEALETARPLIEDTLDDVTEAWARLQQVAEIECGEA